MPRKKRPENKGLPTRWTHEHGAFYYYVPKGQETHWGGKRKFHLGRTLPEAHRTWAAHIEQNPETLATISHLLDRYALEVIPTKAASTQRENLRCITRLKPVFGHMPVMGFQSHYAYRYLDKRGKQAPTAANHEMELLSHAFTKAIEWGVPLTVHPMIQGKFKKLSRPPRERSIEDWELQELTTLTPRGNVRMLLAYLKVKLLTGRRRVELLRLRTTDLLPDGVQFPLAKQKQTGKKSIIVEWSDALRASIQDALAARPVDISPWIFCKRDGTPYADEHNVVCSGWDSVWQRFVARVLKETKITERFTEHDFRAKAGTEAESIERAQALLAHSSKATTARVYRRRPERVKPLR